MCHSLLLLLPVSLLPMAYADVVDYQVNVLDQGYGFNGTVSIPTFNPELGTLESVDLSASFHGALLNEGGQSSYNMTIFPSLQIFGLGYFSATIPVSGLAQNGQLVGFSGSDGGYTLGPTLIGPPQSESLQAFFDTSVGGVTGDWSLYYDSASLNIQYDYDPVPEPAAFFLSAAALLAIILSAEKRA